MIEVYMYMYMYIIENFNFLPWLHTYTLVTGTNNKVLITLPPSIILKGNSVHVHVHVPQPVHVHVFLLESALL